MGYDDVGFWLWNCPYVWVEGKREEECYRFYLVTAGSCAVFTGRGQIATIPSVTNVSDELFSLFSLSKCGGSKTKRWVRHYFLAYTFGSVAASKDPKEATAEALFANVEEVLFKRGVSPIEISIDLRMNGKSVLSDVGNKPIAPRALSFSVDLYDPSSSLFYLRHLVPWQFGTREAPPIEIPLAHRSADLPQGYIFYKNLSKALAHLNVTDPAIVKYIHDSALAKTEEWAYFEGVFAREAEAYYRFLTGGESFVFYEEPEEESIIFVD